MLTIVPLLLLAVVTLMSLLWQNGSFSLANFKNQQLLIAHAVISVGLYIGYYLIILKVRATLSKLREQHQATVEKLEEQTGLLHLETFQHRKTSDELHHIRTRDPITEIFNQNYFYELLSNEVERKKRYDNDFSLLLIEMDNFVRINKMYGHECGNFAMKTFAELMSKKLRKSDLLARYNGHNFAIIAPSTDINASKLLADRLCNHIEISNIHYEGVPLKITLSIGVGSALSIEELTSENIILETENALNIAVEQGGNQAVKIFNT